MKKLIIILAFAFSLLCNMAYAKSLKFVQITDVLYGKANSVENLQKAIDDINKMNDIDFVVFTGDNTAKADADLLKDFTKYINTLNRYPHNKARKVGFCITNPDGSHDFYEIEKFDNTVGSLSAYGYGGLPENSADRGFPVIQGVQGDLPAFPAPEGTGGNFSHNNFSFAIYFQRFPSANQDTVVPV